MERSEIKKTLIQYVKGDEDAQTISAKAKKLATYQFGVPKEEYAGIISFTEFVNITYEHQSNPSQLEIDTKEESKSWL